jgi:hypothetical protein
MKNDFIIEDEVACLIVKRPDGAQLHVKIDTVDLPKAKQFPNAWSAILTKGKYIIKGTCREYGAKKQFGFGTLSDGRR